MNVELHLGDCLDILPTLADHSVEAIITDLPYGTTACKWDEIIPFAPMWKEVKRILKPRGVFVTTASQPFTSKLVMSNLEWFKYCWVWDKSIAGNVFIAEYQPLKIHEDVCVFSENGHNYNPIMKRGKYRTKGGGVSKLFGVNLTKSKGDDYYPVSIIDYSNAVRGDHPTQKPVALYTYLILTYTNPGDTVLDFCAGSGTTMVSCIDTGRNGIAIEKDADYFKIIQERVKLAQQQPRLEGI